MNFKLDPPQDVTQGPAPHPGEFIKNAVLAPFGLNVLRTSELLHVNRQSLIKTLQGGQALTPDLAYRLEALTGIDADLLVAMQAAFERDRDAGKREAYRAQIERLPDPVDEPAARKTKKKAPSAGEPKEP